MEQDNQVITSVSLQNGIISVVYENGDVENMQNSKETFVAMHNKWLVSQPPFISDLYKVQMRNIILTSINNNQKCINDLCAYFSEGNEDEVKKFLTYMRKRDLTEEKNKWSTLSASAVASAESASAPTVPTDPAPTEPAPTEPAPTEPAPTEPAPTEPAPTEPAPTEPAPTEPAPI